jgi:hypothetical protein
MDDLVSKFFKEDLTQAEDQALQDLLLNSDEAAIRFDEQAQARYQRYGLPDPQWPEGGSAGPGSRGLGPHDIHLAFLRWLHWGLLSLVWVLAAAIVGVVGWTVWRGIAPADSVSVSTMTPAVSPMAGSASSGPAPGVGTAPPEVHASIPAVGLAASAAGSPWVPLLTPIDASENPGRTFSDLAVTVHKAAAGAVTVQVFTLEGAPIALLYQGSLPAGTWVFDWNGKTQSAQSASPGYYEIRLESQSGVQKKIIQIH